MEIKDIVKQTSEMIDEDVVWYPLYPNNMISNGQSGIYTILSHEGSDNEYCGRKYTIEYQYKLDEKGCNTDEIEAYNLFECILESSDTPYEIIPPRDDSEVEKFDLTVNEKGDFIRSFSNIESAKSRALEQYKFVFAYALAFLI